MALMGGWTVPKSRSDAAGELGDGWKAQRVGNDGGRQAGRVSGSTSQSQSLDSLLDLSGPPRNLACMYTLLGSLQARSIVPGESLLFPPLVTALPPFDRPRLLAIPAVGVTQTRLHIWHL